MNKLDLDIEKMNAEERLALMEQLWDSLRKNPDQISLSKAQEDELDRRLDDLEADLQNGIPGGIPWEDVLRRIQNRSC